MSSHPRTLPTPRTRSTRVFFLTLGLITMFFVLTVGASWTNNVLTRSPKTSVSTDIQALFPQGWAFFTKSPREPAAVPYLRTAAGDWVRADSLPQSSAGNLFGLSRNQRAQGTELAIIAQLLPGFQECADYVSSCLESAAPPRTVLPSPTRARQFCGDLTIVMQEPVKFGYRDRVPSQTRAVSLARVAITC
ncbi:SdpA family antimicrobial peptide system protein [Mycetocola saprophilus]|uniref:SdpA family antimicrobial peptide system protein n=1 Tax=Mycetocola saprophilus TaxID=76636 RepID=UPI0009DDD0A1|nr:SdpA family antimicrobial peptide system protein [Mycetocola saprophilus]